MIDDIAHQNGLPAMDLFPEFMGSTPEQDLWVTPADAHPNVRGQAIIARGIYDGLKGNGHLRGGVLGVFRRRSNRRGRI